MPELQLLLWGDGDFCSPVNDRPRLTLVRIDRYLIAIAPSAPIADDCHVELVAAAARGSIKLGPLKNPARLERVLARRGILPRLVVGPRTIRAAQVLCGACGRWLPRYYVSAGLCEDCRVADLVGDDCQEGAELPARATERASLWGDWGASVVPLNHVPFRRVG